MVVDCSTVTCIPVEIFSLFIGISVAVGIFGFIRQPQIPAMLAIGGMFILFASIMIGGIIMGIKPDSSTTSGSTTTYDMTDNIFDFRGFPQMLFSLVGSIMMLVSGIMVSKV